MNLGADERVKEAQSEADKNELLAWAAARGLLLDGTDPHVKDKKGRFPIHFAAAKGHADVVQYLGTRGVDLDCEDSTGRSPLHHAALGGHTEVLLFLVKKGVWLDGCDADDDTALHLAARKGAVAAVRALLSGGAKVNLSNKRSLTPLGEAVVGGHTEVAQALLDKGADVSVRSRGFTLLHLASGLGQAAAMQLLLRSGGSPLSLLVKDASNDEAVTPLHAAAIAASQACAELLLREGADASVRNSSGQMAVDLVVLPPASDKGHAAAKKLKELLQKEAEKKGIKPAPTPAPASSSPAASASKPKGILKNKGDPVPTSSTSTSASGEKESEQELYAKRFNRLDKEDQLRKIGAFARMDEKELKEQRQLSEEAIKAIDMVRQVERAHTCYSAMVALRLDEEFQEGLRDPAFMAAIEDVKATNSLEKYQDSPSMMQLFNKVKRVRMLFQENGDRKVNLDDLKARDAEKASEDQERIKMMAMNLQGAKLAAIDAITGEPGSAMKKKGDMYDMMEKAKQAMEEEAERLANKPKPTTWQGKLKAAIIDGLVQMAALVLLVVVVGGLMMIAGHMPWSTRNMAKMYSGVGKAVGGLAKQAAQQVAQPAAGNNLEGMAGEL